MKVLFVIVQHDDVSNLGKALTAGGYRSTRYASSGGFLRRGNETFLIGVEDEEVEDVLLIVRETCRPRTQAASNQPAASPEMPFPGEVRVGRAIVFILPAENFLHL